MTRISIVIGKDVMLWHRIISAIRAITCFYDKMNTIMTLGLEKSIRKLGISLINYNKHKVILDIGSGPGTSTRMILSKKPSYIIALDPSPEMLANTCLTLEPNCDRVSGVAENLPLRNKGATIATMFFSVRDFINPIESFKEVKRVSDEVIIADVFIPSNIFFRIIAIIWICHVVPIIAIIITGKLWRNYLALCSTLKGWTSVEGLVKVLRLIGIPKVTVIKKYLSGIMAIIYVKLS